MYERVENKSLPVSVIAESQELIKLENCLRSYKTLLTEKSPTARLWLQYIEYIETWKLLFELKEQEIGTCIWFQ